MTDPTLESLRLAGAHHHDPVRFHYLETLDRKMRAQPNAVQNLLAPRLHNALVAYAQNVSSQPRPQPHRAAGRSADTSLGQLNRDLDARHRAEASQAKMNDGVFQGIPPRRSIEKKIIEPKSLFAASLARCQKNGAVGN